MKPFIGGYANGVEGKLRLNQEVVNTLRGRWDDTVHLVDGDREKVSWRCLSRSPVDSSED